MLDIRSCSVCKGEGSEENDEDELNLAYRHIHARLGGRTLFGGILRRVLQRQMVLKASSSWLKQPKAAESDEVLLKGKSANKQTTIIDLRKLHVN